MLKWIIAIIFCLTLSQPVFAIKIEEFRASAEQGNVQAQALVTFFDELRVKAEQGDAEALSLLEYIADADEFHAWAALGDAQAQYILGKRYTNGIGPDGEPDYAEAAKWYTMAAEQGHAEAQYQLAGMSLFMGADAWVWLNKAALQGHVEAQYSLGGMYARGWAKVNDDAAIQDDPASYYAEGFGVLPDSRKSKYDFLFFLPTVFLATPDYPSVVKWYTEAANQGYMQAQFALGEMYENGEGVPQDYAEALKWYMLAVEQRGGLKAQYRIDNM